LWHADPSTNREVPHQADEVKDEQSVGNGVAEKTS
jgi:hypothetical protein